MSSNGALEEAKTPLIEDSALTVQSKDQNLTRRIWIESNKLWCIAGPVATAALHLTLCWSSSKRLQVIWLGMASVETLCGQAFGNKKYYMLGVYIQRSWIVLFIHSILFLAIYLFATPVLKLLGQPKDLVEMSGMVAVWMIPLHFSFAFQFPLQRFLQSQLKTIVIACVTTVALLVHIFVTGTAVCEFSWWVLALGHFGYAVCGGCPLTWAGFFNEAFFGPWEFVKLYCFWCQALVVQSPNHKFNWA